MLRNDISYLLALTLGLPGNSYSFEGREAFKASEAGIVAILAADAKAEENALGNGLIIWPLEVITGLQEKSRII